VCVCVLFERCRRRPRSTCLHSSRVGACARGAGDAGGQAARACAPGSRLEGALLGHGCHLSGHLSGCGGCRTRAAAQTCPPLLPTWLPQVIDAFQQLRAAGVDVVTLGQYMRPTKKHMAVSEYITPEVCV